MTQTRIVLNCKSSKATVVEEETHALEMRTTGMLGEHMQGVFGHSNNNVSHRKYSRCYTTGLHHCLL